MLRGVFAAYFTLLHIAYHISIDTKHKNKRRMDVKLKHTCQPATREVSVHILNIDMRVLRTFNLF